MRQQRIADLVANSLRRQILDGEISEGERLPPQEELLAHFNVSLPSVREALRILEVEGLVTVKRGNQGGAVVRRPTVRSTAYMQCLLLQSRRVEVGDVARALAFVEPLCAQLCAEREDRHEAVIPKLEAVLEGERHQLEADIPTYNRAARAFHQTVVELCGNETLALIVGGLVLTWSAHEHPSNRWLGREDEFPSADLRAMNFEVHQGLLEAIRSGDGSAAWRAYADHLATNRHSHYSQFTIDDRMRVDASLIRQPFDERPSLTIRSEPPPVAD